MNNLNKNREYQNKQVEQDLYQFEMGNELGAQLERNKDMHELEYQQENISQHMDKCRVQNKMSKQNSNGSSK